MPPSQYLLRVLSKPTKVPQEKWSDWYANEHVPDTVKAGVTDRGAFFKAYNDFPLAVKTPSKADAKSGTELNGATLKDFEEWADDFVDLAVYQTKFENYAQSEEMKKISPTSEAFGGEAFFPLAQWDVRVYKLIQNYDPDNIGESQPPYTLHVQCEPADEAEYHKFYEEEHFDLLRKVPGYRRGQRYELINHMMGEVKPVPRFLVIHEFSSLDALDGPELKAANATPAVGKVFGNAKAANVRGFKCVKGMGFRILVKYDDSKVDTAKPFSKQGNNYCGVVLAKHIEDGEYYEDTKANNGFQWTAKTELPLFDRSPVTESMENKQNSSSGLRYLGYTVNGRTYNITKDEEKNIPKASEDVQEDWLKQQGYVVVLDLANYKRKTPEKKDVSERSEQQE